MLKYINFTLFVIRMLLVEWMLQNPLGLSNLLLFEF